MATTRLPTKSLTGLLAGLAAGLALFSIGSSAFALEAGEKAPVINLPGPGGNVDLAALKGKVVYLDFWASWCAPCKQSFPWMNEIQSKYRDAGLQIVAVNLDTKAAEAQKFLSAVPANFSIAFDPKGESAQRYQVKAMPSSYLIDRKGNIQLVHTGFNQGTRDKLEAAVIQALKTQP